MSQERRILAGDIGGTKTHLALFDPSGGFKKIREEKFPSKEYDSLSKILHRFLSAEKDFVEKACLGIAGPVQEGRCQATNLPWIVDARELSKELGILKIWLINDLESNAYGLSCLKKEELFDLNPNAMAKKGNVSLISAGTGLGEAGLYWDGEQHIPFATEGGHVDFAPRDELEIEFWRYLRKKYEHVSYERVLSGPGLYSLYRFLIDGGHEKEGEGLEKEFAQRSPSKVISEKALKKEDKACIRALEWFVSIYGSEAGNLALKFLSIGGVYLGGGIAPNILNALGSGSFMRAFVSKGRFSPLLREIPVRVILNENTALLGAVEYARRME